MAHELTHVVQQRQLDTGSSSEGSNNQVTYQAKRSPLHIQRDATKQSITPAYARTLSDQDLLLEIQQVESTLASISENSNEHQALRENLRILREERLAFYRSNTIQDAANVSGEAKQPGTTTALNTSKVVTSIPVIFIGEEVGDTSNTGLGNTGLGNTGLGDIGNTGFSPSFVSPDTTSLSDNSGTSIPRFLAPGFASSGLSFHTLAMGNLSWLDRSSAARFALSRRYWSSFVPRQGDIFLDRLGNTFPRNLEPRYLNNPQDWLSRGFTQVELERIPNLVRKWNAGTATPQEIALLRRAAALHIGGATPGAPFASYMRPGHVLDWASNKRFRVRVVIPSGGVLDVSGPNAFNQFGQFVDITNIEEAEFLATTNNQAKIVSVERAAKSGEAGFLMRHSNKLRWGGRVLFVVGLATSGYRISTTQPEKRKRVIGEEVGGLALGAAGTSLAVSGCVAFGIVTSGVGLFICGLVGGIAGTAIGTSIGGATAESIEQGGTSSFGPWDNPNKMCCFPGKVVVETHRGPQRIDQVKPGDKVMALNSENGQVEEREVTKLEVHEGEFHLLDLEAGGSSITVTTRHFFRQDSGSWISSEQIHPNCGLVGLDGSVNIQHASTPYPWRGTVYNLKVVGNNYFVGKQPLLVRDY